jgi:predicted Zn finger-like uncharacterized protein
MSAPAPFECPHCGARLKLPDASKLGKTVRCPKCKEHFSAGPASTKQNVDEERSRSSAEFEDLEEELAPAPSPARRAKPQSAASKKARRGTFEESREPSRPRKDEGFHEGWSMAVWPLGGLVGGGVVGLIWIFAACMMHHDWSIFAWGMGAGTGGGVGYTASKRGNKSSGVLAAVMTVVLIVTFKFLIAVITVHQSGALEGQSQIGETFAGSFGVFGIVFAIFGIAMAYHVGRGLN